MNAADLGIDLGTSSILVYVRGKGVVLKEPSVVAFDKDTNRIKAIGEEARLMLGRTPGNIVGIRPLRKGVISDYTITEHMLKYFIQKSLGRMSFRKPRISICVPSGITEVEKKAVEDAAYLAGAREVAIIEEPIAAAIGAGVDISRPCGNMIVDIGGGTTDVAVISLNGIVVSSSIKVAGDDFDEAIVRYVRKKYNLLIGEQTAEDIKIRIGTAVERPEAAKHGSPGQRSHQRPSESHSSQFGRSTGCVEGCSLPDRRDRAEHPGENSARTGFGCGRSRNCPYRRRFPSEWTGRTDRG